MGERRPAGGGWRPVEKDSWEGGVVRIRETEETADDEAKKTKVQKITQIRRSNRGPAERTCRTRAPWNRLSQCYLSPLATYIPAHLGGWGPHTETDWLLWAPLLPNGLGAFFSYSWVLGIWLSLSRPILG